MKIYAPPRFTHTEQADLQRIAREIVEEIAPVAIYFYGSCVTGEIRRSCFTRERDKERRMASYHLLVLADPRRMPPQAQRELLAKRISRQIAQVHLIVHSTTFVEAELWKGSFFFSRILRAGVRLYDPVHNFSQQPHPFHLPPLVYREPRIRRSYHACIRKSGIWLRKAEDFRRRDCLYDSLICLKRSLEYSMKAVIKIGTGYDIRSHGWEPLLRFAEGFTAVPAVFSTFSAEERRLHELVTRPVDVVDPLTLKLTPAETAVLLRRAALLKGWAENFLWHRDMLWTGRRM